VKRTGKGETLGTPPASWTNPSGSDQDAAKIFLRDDRKPMRPILIDPTKGSVGRIRSAAVFGLSASWTGGTADLLSFGSGDTHQHRPIGARQAENLAFLATLGW